MRCGAPVGGSLIVFGALVGDGVGVYWAYQPVIGRDGRPRATDTNDGGYDALTASAAALDRLGWVALVLAVLMCAFVAITTIVIFAPVGRAFADWLTYVHAVERVLAGQPIYPPEQLIRARMSCPT